VVDDPFGPLRPAIRTAFRKLRYGARQMEMDRGEVRCGGLAVGQQEVAELHGAVETLLGDEVVQRLKAGLEGFSRSPWRGNEKGRGQQPSRQQQERELPFPRCLPSKRIPILSRAHPEHLPHNGPASRESGI
jgi:hypothetical protein